MRSARQRMIETSLPRAGRATLRRQAEHEARRPASPLRNAGAARRIRGDNVQPIQDLTSLTDIGVSVEMDKKVRGVRLIPEGEALEFRVGKGRVEFTVPQCRGHQMVEIAF